MAYPTTLPAGQRRYRPIVLGGVLALAVAAVLWQTGALASVRQIVPGLSSDAPHYQTTTVRQGNVVKSVIATGPIAGVNTTPLTFKTSGKLASLRVGVGTHVTAGQVLAVLDPSDLQTALNQAQATLDQAQANLTKVEAGPTDAQKAVAQASVDNARTSAANAQASVSTSKTSAANSITAAQQSVHVAQLNLAATQHSLAAAQDQEARGIAADQTAVTNAQKNLETVKSTVAADGPILQYQIDKAKDSLWSTQIGRDATCSRSQGTDCQAANASVASAETSLAAAQAQADQSRKQDQQSIVQAQTQLDQANAQLSNDRAKLAASVVSAQDQLKQSEAALAGAQNGVVQAQAQATATVQNAQAGADQATGSLKAAQANYAQNVAPPEAADVAAAKAQVVNAQAALDTARANLQAATLTAPSDGTIAAINGAVGQFVAGGPVASGDTALFTMVDLNALQVTAQVNEADIGEVKVGDPVNFTVSAFPNATFAGKVLTIQPVGTVVQNVVNYAVTCSIQSAKGATLYPGMTAAATIVSAEHRGVLTVPNSALTFAQEAFRDGLVSNGERPGQQRAVGTRTAGSTTPARPAARQPASRAGNSSAGSAPAGQAEENRGVVLTEQEGKLVPIRVTLGLTDGTITEVTSGFKGGESIVLGEDTGGAAGAGNRNGGQRSGGSPFGGGFRG